MPEPTVTFDEYLRRIRAKGLVPIGILSYDVDKKEFILNRIDVDEGELRALLDTLGVKLKK